MSYQKELGRAGESFVEEYLLSKGYKIIKRNWFCYAGELDIVAYKKDIVFIEVKTLNSSINADPSELLTRKKRLKWYHTANYFLLRHKLLGVNWRFDFFGVIKYKNGFSLRHYINISLP